ncbi:MAG TPA: thioesterase family protein [Planctomycetaceae bacterium]|jgi:acyl-CoA thioester hydrolase|nr:thioesterase family protein [Planctomycetaceae bacterium]
MGPYEHEIPIRVRYCETDAMGFLHHSNFLSYFEMGRTELFRAQGGDYRKMEEGGHFFVVVEMNVKYRAPARFDDVLSLRTRVVRVTPAKLEHDYKLSRDGMVIADAHSILACVDRDGRVRRISDVVPELTEMQPDRRDPPPS